MKSFIILALFVAAVAAAPPSPDAAAQVLRNELNNIGVEGFNSAYETSNGIQAQAEGQLVNPGTENEALVMRGQFSYVGTEGVTYTVNWVADQNGFQPQGKHLPSV